MYYWTFSFLALKNQLQFDWSFSNKHKILSILATNLPRFNFNYYYYFLYEWDALDSLNGLSMLLCLWTIWCNLPGLDLLRILIQLNREFWLRKQDQNLPPFLKILFFASWRAKKLSLLENCMWETLVWNRDNIVLLFPVKHGNAMRDNFFTWQSVIG